MVELLSERVKPGPPAGSSSSSSSSASLSLTSSSSGNKRGISSISKEEVEIITLPGYDNFGQPLFQANDWVMDKFQKTIMSPVLAFFEQSIPPFLHQSPTVRPILLIERKTEAYFKQAYAEKQPAFWTSGIYAAAAATPLTACYLLLDIFSQFNCCGDIYLYKHIQTHITGSQRRSILNHVELSAALQSEFGDDFASVSLEGTSVSFQCLLFSRAKVVIAQHGELV